MYGRMDGWMDGWMAGRCGGSRILPLTDRRAEWQTDPSIGRGGRTRTDAGRGRALHVRPRTHSLHLMVLPLALHGGHLDGRELERTNKRSDCF